MNMGIKNNLKGEKMKIVEFNPRTITRVGQSYYLAIAPQWVRTNGLDNSKIAIIQIADENGNLILKKNVAKETTETS